MSWPVENPNALAYSALSTVVAQYQGVFIVRAKPGLDQTDEINDAIIRCRNAGGGRVLLLGEIFWASRLTLMRTVYVSGLGSGITEVMILPGVNADFVVSENFSSLTNTGATTSDNRVPSYFGISNLRINGNKSQNSSGRGLCTYGPRMVWDDLIVYNCASDGIHTEYSASIGSSGWQGQEESYFGEIVSRNNVGKGWLNRGPHNLSFRTYLGAYNGDWGYYADKSANYAGNVTEAGQIHTYANVADKGSFIGEVHSINHLVIDGDYAIIASGADNTQIDRVKGVFLGQSTDGLDIQASYCNVAQFLGTPKSGSTGSSLLKISGNYNTVGQANLTGFGADLDGLEITGNGNSVSSLLTRECNNGLILGGGINRVNGRLINNNNGFSYTRSVGSQIGKNFIGLHIYAGVSGQTYVAGDAPIAASDEFSIKATGIPGSKSTEVALQSGAALVDTTSSLSVTVAHGLLYNPAVRDVSVDVLRENVDATYGFAYVRVNSVDDTNVVVGYRMATAGISGATVRFAIKIKLH